MTSKVKRYWQIIKRERKSAKSWLKDTEFKELTIIEPTGWDPINFVESWNEKITRDEFRDRALMSVCKLPPGGPLRYNCGVIIRYTKEGKCITCLN